MKSKILIIKYCAIITLFLCAGCKKFIEVKAPETSVTSDIVYAGDNTAISVLTGMYQKLVANLGGTGTIGSMSWLTDLSADNLTLYYLANTNARSFYQNNFAGNDGGIFWNLSYPQIYVANAAIEGLTASTSLTPAIKQQLLGEAKFMRAFYFFYLVNLYGDVPLTLSTDYKVNANIKRTPVEEVYKQIITDLKDAESLLNDDYMDVTLQNPSVERIRPNKAAATALLARVYLYTGDWADAEEKSTEVINNPAYALVDLNAVFLKNSKATIWSLQPIQSNLNTWEGNFFNLPSTGPSYAYPVYLSDQLIDSFEVGDQRLNQWTGNVTVGGKTYYYANKYKIPYGVAEVTEYEIVLRLAEQYLIRAEARAQQNNLTGPNSAISDLDSIRTRAGLLPSTATTKGGVLAAIEHERQVELFTEWGHRWLDLKRTGNVDAVMSVAAPLKGATWASYKALYPLPPSDIDKNPALKGGQNPGY